MDVMQLVAETLEEIDADLETALEGLTTEEVEWRPSDEANSIGFTLWHLIRAEDYWLSDFARKLPHIFERNGWVQRWGMAGAGTGAGYGKEELAAFVTPPMGELWQYGREVREQTLAYLTSLRASQFDDMPTYDIRGLYHTDSVQPAARGLQGYTIGRMFHRKWPHTRLCAGS